MQTAQKAFWPILLVLSWIFAGFSVASAGGFGPAQGSSGGGSGGATTSAWSDVLANGATSGANSPIIADGQTLQIGATAYKASLFAGSSNGLQVTASNDSTSSTRFMAQVSGTFSDGGTNSTTTAEGLRIAPTINYTGGTKSGHYEALSILATETSLPTGANYLIRASAGAAGTTDKFAVTNGGLVEAVNGSFSAPSYTFLSSQSYGLSFNGVSTLNVSGLLGQLQASGTISPDARYLFTMYDDAPRAVGVGGGFAFGCRSADTPTYTTIAGIQGYKEANDTGSAGSLGFWTSDASANANAWLAITSAGVVRAKSTGVIGFSSGSPLSTAADTGLSRDAAGVVDFGTGAQGSTAGSIKLTGITQAGTGQHTWGTGGSPSATAPQILGPVDAGLFMAAGTPSSSGAGKDLTVSAGLANGSGNAGGSIWLASAISGTGTTSANLVKITNAGRFQWQTGLGAPGATTATLYGPSDQDFYVAANGSAASRNLIVTGGWTSSTTGGQLIAQGGNCNSGTGAGGLGSFSGGNASGSNQNGGAATLATGLPTGTGSADVAIQTGYPLASSSTAQAATDRDRVSSKTKALTNNTATTFCNVLLPTSNSSAGVTVFWTVIVADAAGNEQTTRGQIQVALNNKAGTVTAGTIQAIGTNATQLVTGTDAISFGTSIASTTVSLQVTSNSSLTITSHVIEYRVLIDGGPAVTSAPQ